MDDDLFNIYVRYAISTMNNKDAVRLNVELCYGILLVVVTRRGGIRRRRGSSSRDDIFSVGV